jgi:outer membrane protein assembly factor BamA
MNRICVLVGIIAALFTSPTPGLAQEDNTGTNPVNFTYDARFITEVAEFEEGGGSLLTSTFEFRWPLGRNVANLKGKEKGSLFYDMGNKAAMRVRARYQNLSVDTPGAPPFDTSEVSGIGDFDARILYMAHTGKKLMVATGLEAFFDTASNDALGSGKTSLGPQVFTVFPGILGGRSLFAPGYQYVFDIAGDDSRSDISRSQIDLYLVWLLSKGKNWLIVDPQAILDHENEQESGTVEAEWGFMIAPSVGASGYLRPGIGVGAEKPYSWNLEVGLKFVWR